MDIGRQRYGVGSLLSPWHNSKDRTKVARLVGQASFPTEPSCWAPARLILVHSFRVLESIMDREGGITEPLHLPVTETWSSRHSYRGRRGRWAQTITVKGSPLETYSTSRSHILKSPQSSIPHPQKATSSEEVLKIRASKRRFRFKPYHFHTSSFILLFSWAQFCFNVLAGEAGGGKISHAAKSS